MALKTLGALDLREPGGAVVQSVLAQPKRTALFLYLAIARPHGLHQRETLLNLFWGERDEEHARKALRQALYYLRASLGDDIIVSIGDGEVGIARERVWCDAVELERALAEGRWADALELYRGELLPGFFVEDAPEFERWLEAERAHVRDRVVGAAWALSRQWQERDDATHAVAAATRAVELVPDDEAGVRALMRLLAQSGQSNGAVRAYEQLETRLRREHDAVPDPETRAVVEQIRAASVRNAVRAASVQNADALERKLAAVPPAASQAERASTPSGAGAPVRVRGAVRRRLAAAGLLLLLFLGAVWLGRARTSSAGGAAPALDPAAIAVLPFRASGLAGSFAGLGTGVFDLLSTKLNAGNVVRAVDPRTVMFAWEQTRARVGVNVPLDTALAVARRVGAARLLLGSVVGAGGDVTLDGVLYSVPDGRVIGRPHAAGDTAAFPQLIDRFAAQSLSLAAGEDATRIEDLTTRSLPALQAYLAGRAAYLEGRYEAARTSFAHALQLDSTFALAGLGVMVATTWAGEPERGGARRAHLLAWANRERLSERDRFRLLALTGVRWPEPTPVDEQIAFVERALLRMPDNPELWYQLGEIFLHNAAAAGIGDWHVRATKAFERAVELDSTFVDPLLHLVHLAAERRDTASLRRAVLARHARGTDAHDLAANDWLLAQLTGDSTQLRADGVVDMALWPDRSLIGAMLFALSFGVGVADAERALRVRLERALTAEQRAPVLLNMQMFALARGRPDEALRIWQLRAREARDTLPRHAVMREAIYVALYANGSEAAAEQAARAIVPHAGTPLSRQDVYELHDQLRDICALQLWRLSRGDTASVAVAAEELRRFSGAAAEPWFRREPQVCSALVETLLAERRGSLDRRIVQRLDSILAAQPVIIENGDVLPGSHRLGTLVVARLWESLGDIDAALAAIQRRRVNTLAVMNPASQLSEECRLAIRARRSDLARDACERFFTLMSDPEPSVRPQVESLRSQYAQLGLR